jgi:peptidoglycan/xylan/chitin deacetylase (PgdA/CDA1 family)
MGKQKYVAISFDDGPSPNTMKVVKILKNNGVKATFFLVGNRIPSNLDTRTILSRGEIGNHTNTHTVMGTMTVEQVRSEIASGSAAIETIFGAKPKWFRSQGLCQSKAVKSAVQAEKANYIGGVLVGDYGKTKSNNAKDIYTRAITRARSGKVLILHDLNAPTIVALPRILKWYRQHGYKVVIISELVSKRGK